MKHALLYILEDTLNQEHMHVDILTYNDAVRSLKYDSKNFTEKIQTLKAGGLTHFSNVFDKIVDMTKSHDNTGKITLKS